ncbi:MAG: hypothetical protein ACU0DT_03760, partial [Albimonas sp.]|uniref:hypothetical protein n=1 Tax=Albimonas sp. TaxID=1872425 RepID=UPI0040567C11
ALPAARIEVTWADPAAPGGPPLRSTVETPALPFRAVVPEGAADLDPFIAASDLTLVREVEGEPQGMAPGDALSVTLRATIAGASPMLLPPLADGGEIEGLAAYPDAPELVETEERGRLGGTRTERLSLLAEGGGAGELPAIALRWWDLDEGRIKVAEVPALAISVDGLPARSGPADPAARLRLALLAGAGLASLLLLVWLARRAAPPLRRRLAARRAARLASEGHAWGELQAVLRRRDAAALRPALDRWAARAPGDPRAGPQVQAALLALGAARYGPRPPGEAAADWRALSAALAAARRRRAPGAAAAAGRLPPLNPVG